MPLRVVLLGTSAFAVPTLRALRDGPDDLLAVFTRPDRPAGRGLHLRPSPIKAAAQELAVPVYQPERVSREEGVTRLREVAPDVLLVVAFGEILTEEVLSLPRIGSVNLHASLLPKYRGAAPMQRALMDGAEVTGATAQWMAKGLDTGDTIVQHATPIAPDEDFGSLHDRLAAQAAETARETLALLREGRAPRVPQDDREATYAPPIQREELEIDWGQPAARIHGVVRALAPRPGARTRHQGRLLKILMSRVERSSVGTGGVPGQVIEMSAQGLRVQTGRDSLVVLRVQPEGRTPMSAGDYALGHHLQVGQVLGAWTGDHGLGDG